MRLLTIGLIASLLGGCVAGGGGCQRPSPRYIYRLALEAAESSAEWPEGAKALPIGEARIGLGKNAASVDVPFVTRDASGAETTGWITVWFHRVARTWTVVRAHATPDYTQELEK